MIWIAAIAVLVLVMFPFIIEGNRKELQDYQDEAPGKFAELPHGRTHYQWFGPSTGDVMVCVHGLTTPSVAWSRLVDDLAGRGYRVLTYDLYGRGFSDRPKELQTGKFHCDQLTDLLTHLKLERSPITLMGYSMGGVIATQYAALNPKLTKGLILLAPAGMAPLPGGLINLVRKGGIFGEYLMLMLYPRILRKGIASENDPDIGPQQLAELGKQGFIPAVVSSLRGVLPEPLREDHMIVKRYGIPVLAIWGEEDDVIPKTARETLAEWNETAHQHVVKGAGHGVTYTHASEVFLTIRKFTGR